MRKEMTGMRYVALFVLGFCLGMWAAPAHALKQDVNSEAFCLAQNIYFEAGNQPLAGKIGVALVTMNRVNSEQFPKTICEVVYETKEYRTSWKTGEQIPRRGMCQFSWYCDGKSDEPKDSKTWIASQQLANQFLLTQPFDLTEGAMWYHADYIYPYWAQHLNETVHINAHIFYK
jgi:spore germination cell wall hydrolase CwlJ-like protein